MPGTEPIEVDCPYCGERLEFLVDASGGAHDCVEDCRVCCRPIEVHVAVDNHGAVAVTVRREDEA